MRLMNGSGQICAARFGTKRDNVRIQENAIIRLRFSVSGEKSEKRRKYGEGLSESELEDPLYGQSGFFSVPMCRRQLRIRCMKTA